MKRSESRHDLPRSFYVRAAGRVSILKSLWWSARCRGPVVVGRGSRVRVHRSATLELRPGSLLLVGMHDDLPTGAVLRLHPRAAFVVGGRVQLLRGTTTVVRWDARLELGHESYLNEGATITCARDIRIGAGCAVASGAVIMDTDTHALLRSGVEGARSQPVVIGRHCWIGTRAVVLKGAQLGDDVVVAAGAVVTGSVPAGTLVGGVPARPLATDVTWVT